MKLWAISDLHVGYKRNLLAIGELAKVLGLCFQQ